MIPLNDEQKLALEQLVDSRDLASVVSALSEIADEKAEHLRSAWQDEGSAKLWNSAALKLARLAVQISRLSI